MRPWELFGGDHWFTHDETKAVLNAAERLVDDRKKAAEEARRARVKRRR